MTTTDATKEQTRLLPPLRYCYCCQKRRNPSHFEGAKKKCRDCEQRAINRLTTVPVPPTVDGKTKTGTTAHP